MCRLAQSREQQHGVREADAASLLSAVVASASDGTGADDDGDGTVSAAELVTATEPILTTLADTNNDGIITEAEAKAFVANADTDGDGEISLVEISAASDPVETEASIESNASTSTVNSPTTASPPAASPSSTLPTTSTSHELHDNSDKPDSSAPALVELDGSVRLKLSEDDYAALLADLSAVIPALLNATTAYFQETVPSAAVKRPTEMPAQMFTMGTPASMRARQPPQTEAIEDEPLDSVMSLTMRMV